jgi:hypothetical protein
VIETETAIETEIEKKRKRKSRRRKRHRLHLRQERVVRQSDIGDGDSTVHLRRRNISAMPCSRAIPWASVA